MKKQIAALAFSFFACGALAAQSEKPLLMQNPTLSATHIVFAYGSELWSVSRDGGAALQLTSGQGQKSNPHFSPDGKWIAFTAQYGGNFNVYIIPAEGGEARQLSYGPGPDTVEGWTPDGKGVLFRSSLLSNSPRYEQLFTISVDGGRPHEVPLPMGYQASFSSDGTHLAYTPLPRELFFVGVPLVHAFWAHYHGGLAPQVWIANLQDSSVTKIPHENASDFNPMWVGNKIYFLSAREEPISLYAYDLGDKKVSRSVENHGMDIMSAGAGPGAIVYEQFGSLHLLDIATGREHEVPVSIRGDFPEVRMHFEKVADHILDAGISPTGARAVFEAHGEILTVPADKGTVRNITNSPGVADRSPAWSPDGKEIAYFSDATGEYALHIKDQDGFSPDRAIGLGNPPSFFFNPVWSPDGRKIAYTDKRLNVWYVDLDNPTPVKIDTQTYFSFGQSTVPVWSPDSRWVAYTKLLDSHMRALFAYSLDSHKSTQITDGLSDAEYPAFDKSGKYLYFTASTNAGPTEVPLDMSSDGRIVTRSVYLIVLQKGTPSPFKPESDDEKVAAAEAAKDKAKEAHAASASSAVQIDFDGIGQRILALPLPAAHFVGLSAGKEGEIYVEQESPEAGVRGGGGPVTVLKFTLAARKATPIAAGIEDFHLSFNGEKFLYRQGEKWGIAATAQPLKPGEGLLDMDSMEVSVHPREEWKQMFHEAWRLERDFFYAKNYDGLDLAAAEKQYSAYLPGIVSRADLNYLFLEMLGKLSTGHTFVDGGDIPKVTPVSVGLLGADYTTENGRYRFAKVYSGENWNPGLRAPLTEPGSEVAAGEYLLAVDGRELHSSENVYSFFLNTAHKQVTLKVGPNADGSGSREVVVVPIASEIPLRHRDWVAENVSKTAKLSGGRLAYVYLPDTGMGGFTSFNRYYYAQSGREGLILDDRFNSGGQAADYIINILQRKLWNYWYTPNGKVATEPGVAIFGPKAMLINQYAGSGGDLIPWFFHHVGVGPLIGERTWGGEVGITGYPALIDGGGITAPSLAFFDTEGHWRIENEGVAPDVEVEMDPKAWREGHDPQLEKAVALLLEDLKQHPLPKPTVPAFPDYYKAN
ncbi:MAG: S41 family peptidase [Candidatus Acidiferrum sp.]